MLKRFGITLLAAATALALPGTAFARKSPLEGQPDVRHKYELRSFRFEVAPTFEATVQADYKHTVSGGLKIEYHLTDNLSFGGMIFFGGSINTQLTDAVYNSLGDTSTRNDPTPSRSQFTQHLNTMPLHGGAGVTFTPWFGKISLFSKLYLAFDVYLSGGLAFAQLKNGMDVDNCAPKQDGTFRDATGTDQPLFDDPRNDCAYNSGFKTGVQVGAGMHIFMNKWIALDISFRDYLFKDNPSGQDFNADRKVDGDDPRFLGHLFVGVGVSLFLPPKVKISP
jgi:outer membrane beta-barrel protein